MAQSQKIYVCLSFPEYHEGEFKELDIKDRYACLRSVNREPGSLISERAKRCDACDITFDTNDELIHHLNTKHGKYTCFGDRRGGLVVRASTL